MLKRLIAIGLAAGLIWTLVPAMHDSAAKAYADEPGQAPQEAPQEAEQEAEQAKEEPASEVDLKVISDPSHEKMNLTAPAKYEVLFKTTAGDFTLEVTRDWAPIGADRFYSLVKNGYYDGNRFFRVVPGFVVQWGLHGNKDVNQAWHDPENRQAAKIKDDQVEKSNTRGRIVFATSGPDSRTTQLFINLGNNQRLDSMGFAPFGQVKGDGMKVVDKLFSGYGEPPGAIQSAIVQNGNSILDEFFPKLDAIQSATIVEQDADDD